MGVEKLVAAVTLGATGAVSAYLLLNHTHEAIRKQKLERILLEEGLVNSTELIQRIFL